MSVGVISALGQDVARPRQLNEQFLRARSALTSGSSLLEAKTRVDRVIEGLPNDAEARTLRSEILIRMGRFEEAAADATEAVRLEPTNGAAHVALAESMAQLGDTTAATMAMTRASQLLDDDASMHVRLSRLARTLDRSDQAVAFARISVALEPNNAACHYELARAFVAGGNTTAAASIVRSGLRSGLLSAKVVETDPLLRRLIP